MKYGSNIKKLAAPIMLVVILCISFQFQMNMITQDANSSTPSKISQSPTSAAGIQYNTPIAKLGNNQTAEVFLQNASSAVGHDSFNITSATNQEDLVQGYYNVTLPQNYNTTYNIEPYDALSTPPHLDSYSNIAIEITNASHFSGDNATGNGVFGGASQINIDSNSGSQNIMEFRIHCNTIQNPTFPNVNYLGFLITLNGNLNQSVGFNLSKYNQLNSSWALDQVVSNNTFSNTISFSLSNTNNQYINSLNQISNFTFDLFNQTAPFHLLLNSITVQPIAAPEVPINQNHKVALEFGTLGNATVYGFQTWIRSYNITAPGQTTNLTVDLYYSNMTNPIVRTGSNSLLYDANNLNLDISPNNATKLAENSFINFTGDAVSWFNLKSDYSGVALNISEFFIVISANTTGNGIGKAYSLVTLPSVQLAQINPAPDGLDQIVITNTTSSWQLTGSFIFPDSCSADNFTLNLTRAWYPSELSLQVESQAVQNTYISNYPYDPNGAYWWGLGTINHTYTSPIPAVNGNFTVPLNWTGSLLAHLDFGVNYLVEKYVIQNTTSLYDLTLNSEPVWNETFALNLSHYANWQFICLKILFPEELDRNEFYRERYKQLFPIFYPTIRN